MGFARRGLRRGTLHASAKIKIRLLIIRFLSRPVDSIVDHSTTRVYLAVLEMEHKLGLGRV